LFACNDVRALQVLQACQRIRLPVPDEVAVLGVDADDILQQIARKTGYLDISHMSRSFKKQFGEWPGEYRLRSRAENRNSEVVHHGQRSLGPT